MIFEIIFSIIGICYISLWIIELIGLHRFNLKFYNYGFKLYEKTLMHKFSNWKNLEDIYTKKEGIYVFLSDPKVGYFVSRFYFFRSYSLIAFYSGIPLTIFGKVSGQNNEIKITFYISYRIVFLISLFFLSFILISIFTWTWLALGIGIFGVLISILMILLIRPFYEGKMLMMADEVYDILKIRK